MLAPASWRFMAPNPGLDAWTLWAGSGGLFLLIPVGRGEVYGWVSVFKAAGQGRDLAASRAAFASFPRLVRDTLDVVLAEPGGLYHSPLEEARVPELEPGPGGAGRRCRARDRAGLGPGRRPRPGRRALC